MNRQDKKFLSFFHRWGKSHDVLVGWAVAQAFLANPSVDPRTRILHITFALHVVNKAPFETIIVPNSFEFQPITNKLAKDEQALLGHHYYANLQDGDVVNTMRFRRSSPYIHGESDETAQTELLFRPCTHWPWVVDQVAMMDLRNMEDVKIQLALTVSVVEMLNDPKKAMAHTVHMVQSFSVPPLFGNEQWRISRREEWNQLMVAAGPCKLFKNGSFLFNPFPDILSEEELAECLKNEEHNNRTSS